MDWKKTIGAVAPTLAKAIGGPIGSVAVGILTSALGIEAGDEKALEKKVESLTAGDLIALKSAEQQFMKDMKALELDFDKLEVQDRMSAREREEKTGDHTTLRVLGGVVVLGFFFSVTMVLSGHVQALRDPTMASLIGTLIGYVSAKADQVVGYYFGSSAGSRAKEFMLRQIGQNGHSKK